MSFGWWIPGEARRWQIKSGYEDDYAIEQDTIASDEVMAAAALVEFLYQWPGCEVGGPLHVVVDDFNLDTPEPYFSDEFPRTEPLSGLCDLICAALLLLNMDQRELAVGHAHGDIHIWPLQTPTP